MTSLLFASTVKQQKGATLVIALIMLVLLTLFAVSAINSSNSNLNIVGNAQAKMQAQAAGQQAIEQVLSSAANFTTPVAQDISIDYNNDGSGDFTANVEKPTCFSSKSLLNSDLIPATGSISAKDQNCISSVQDPSTGVFIAGSTTATSWCYDQKWEVTATVTDNVTGAQVKQHQGVSMRVPAGTDCAS